MFLPLLVVIWAAIGSLTSAMSEAEFKRDLTSLLTDRNLLARGNVPDTYKTIFYVAKSASKMTTVKVEGVKVGEFLKLLTDFNGGATIATKGAAAMLWTGYNGMRKAEAMSKKDTLWFMVGRRYRRGNEFYPDTKIGSLKVAFDAIKTLKESNAISDEWRQYWSEVACMWLLMMTDETKAVDMYASLGPYELGQIIGNPLQRVVADGTKKLMDNGVTKAVVVGSYFWNVEMLVLCRRKVKTNIHLYEYDLKKTEKVTPKAADGSPLAKRIIPMRKQHGWPVPAKPIPFLSKDLTGTFNKIADFPIVFRVPPAHDLFVMKKMMTFHQLVDAYNKQQRDSNLKIDKHKTLFDQYKPLAQLVKWTQEKSDTWKRTAGAVEGYQNTYPLRLQRAGKTLSGYTVGRGAYGMDNSRQEGQPFAAKRNSYNDLGGYFDDEWDDYYDDEYDDGEYDDGDYYDGDYYDGDYFDGDYYDGDYYAGDYFDGDFYDDEYYDGGYYDGDYYDGGYYYDDNGEYYYSA